MIRIFTATIFAYEFAAFKLLHPKSHVGAYPQPNDPLPMKWIMVYPVEMDGHE